VVLKFSGCSLLCYSVDIPSPTHKLWGWQVVSSLSLLSDDRMIIVKNQVNFRGQVDSCCQDDRNLWEPGGNTYLKSRLVPI
jgi:hypothetical protein